MDEDLKIVLTSELEADEQASAQRISAQLPNIAKLINSKSTIKVGVTLDSSKIQGEAQKISRQITQVSRTQAVGVALNLDQSSVTKIQQALNNLKVSPDVSRAMTEQLDKMGIQIDKINAKWSSVAGSEEKALMVTLNGTDQLGRSVSYMGTYNEEMGRLEQKTIAVSENLEKQRISQERLAEQAKRDNESRISFLNQQFNKLEDIYVKYADLNSTKPIHDVSHFTELDSLYQNIGVEITNLREAEGKLSAEQKENIINQISNLDRLVKQYQNVEYVANKLRTKTVVAVNAEETENLSKYENKLRSSGKLTQEFQNRISQLRTQLSTAFDSEKLTAYLNQFDRLKSEVGAFDSQISIVNAGFKKLAAAKNEVFATKGKMVGLDPNSSEYEKMNQLLSLQVAHQKEISAKLGKQIAQNPQLLQYAKEYQGYLYASATAAAQLAIQEGRVKDAAGNIAVSIEPTAAVIQNIEAKFRNLSNAPKELIDRISTLRGLLENVKNSGDNASKITAFKKLKEEISACNKEITQLNGVQTSELRLFRNTEGIEKAKADLATIGRQWSALKQDPGLNAQFQQLGANLKLVESGQMDLKVWTAQFSRFKSEVKAAGKNMQSLGDVFKDNVRKVLQWVSATTLLFRAFRLLKTALSTIVDLDTAMVDLRKVTMETETEYHSFYASANDTAKALGVTTEAVISQTAEWARLGYTMSEAAKLSKNSAIFAAISPGMDITQATDGLVSALKAFDEIDVDDSLDGIISKVNDIGNKFAVSNKDIVEVLTRSSSAMKAANNTFEETVALATAAVEITRDSASVGNALKTVSMRIRGYDEELEEYSDDVAALTGDIADLTKVASNNNRGVSLFEIGNPNTYRSTYDILKDIADIWEELTDKNRAQLLEVLFGKRQGQIGSAILSNFGQAQKAIEKMANSAGSAEREMDKIADSLEYKLNALKQTWVGVAQNLFQSDDLKVIISGLTAVSNAIDSLTQHLGLFGTVGLVTTIAGLMRFKNTLSSINSAVAPVLQSLSNVNYSEGAASILQYASALSVLDPIQQKLAMSLLGLNTAQQEQVTSMMTATVALKQYTVAELEKTAGVEAGLIADKLNISSKEFVTAEILKAALANGTLTEAQLAEIVATNAQTAANTAGTASFVSLGAAAKAAGIAMMATPMGWITVLIGILPLAITLVSKLADAITTSAEEATEKMDESVSKLEEATSKIESLNDELATTKDRIAELEAQDSLTFVEESELQKLRESVELLELQKDLAEKEKNSATENAAKDTVAAYRKNFRYNISADDVQGYVDYGNDLGEDEILFSDKSNISAMLAGIEHIKQLQNEVKSSSEEYLRFQEIIDDATDSIWDQTTVLSEYKRNLEAIPHDDLTNEQKETLDEINASIDFIYKSLDPAKWKEWKWNDIIGDNQYAEDVKKLNDLASQSEVTANVIQSQFPLLAKACTDAGLEISDVVDNLNDSFESANGDNLSVYSDNLSSLSDRISEMRASYDLLEDAKNDMAENGGLSPETIEKLAAAEENYLNYLYEENGVVKLNTEEWEKNAAAKMHSDIAKLQKEINSRKSQNNALRRNLDRSKDGMSKEEILTTTSAIEENNKAIGENQKLLGIYESLYGQITGDLDTYSDSLNNYSNAVVNANSISNTGGISSDLIASFADIETNFKNLSTVMNEFSEEGTASISSLNGLSDAFGKLDSYSDFVEVMMDSTSSAEEAQEAWHQLAQEYVNSLGILNNVTTGNMGVIESFLNQMGVVNAHEVVLSRLSAVQLEAIVAANGLSQATWEETNKFLEEQGVAESTREALRRYRIEQLDAALSATNLAAASSSTISALLSQADAAGVAASSLAALKASMAALTYNPDTYNPEKSVVGSGGIRAYEKIAAKQNQEAKATEIQFDFSKFSNLGGGGGGGGGGSSKEDDPTKELKEQLDKLVGDFEHQIFILEKKGISTATSVVDNATQTAGQIVDIYREMQVAVNQQANKYRSMGLAENSEEIQELQKQWWEYKENIQETMTSCYEYIRRQRENAIMLNEDWLENAVNDKNYTDITRYSNAIIENYKTMQNKLHEQAEYYRSLGYSDTSDEVSKLSDMWHDYANEIKGVRDKVIDYLNDIVDAASDSVDEIQNVSDVLHNAADEFAANDGFITVDTYQELLELGPQYMQMLQDENGLWEINEERINDVIAARTRQLAVENAMAYVEKLKLAAQEGSIEDLNNLIFATSSATNSTWGLVYAELELMHVMGDLNDSQYQAALHNVQAMEDLAENVIQNIGKETDVVAKRLEETRKQLEETKDALQDTLDELEDMQDGANDLVDYVMDMLKHRIQEQIDLLEDMKDKYSEIIDLKKESLDAAKEEQDYDRDIAKKLKEMAKIQERLNALSLDDSRNSKAEQAKLLEELAELQEDLSDTQADKAIENQKEALDAMEKDYHAEKDKEIEILENSISSTQKLYDMAIAYIRDNWNTLYQELIEWNTEYGSVLNSEITEAWEAAQAAAQRYGDFVSAIMGGISDEIESITQQIKDIDLEIESLNTSSSSSSSGGNKNTTVGNKGQHTSPSSAEMVRTIVGRMKEYASQWGATTDKNKQKDLQGAAANLAKQLGQYGVNASFDSSRGVWTITRDDINPSNVGKLLYNCYHTGGFVGDEPLKPNERYIKAEDGELMMTSSQQDSLGAQLDRIRAMADIFVNGVVSGSTSTIGSGLSQIERGTINNITNNSRPIQINIGDTIIQGNLVRKLLLHMKE